MLGLHPFWREVRTAFREVDVRTTSQMPISVSDTSEQGLHARNDRWADVGTEYGRQGRPTFEND